jgi:hypothetical protein
LCRIPDTSPIDPREYPDENEYLDALQKKVDAIADFLPDLNLSPTAPYSFLAEIRELGFFLAHRFHQAKRVGQEDFFWSKFHRIMDTWDSIPYRDINGERASNTQRRIVSPCLKPSIIDSAS